MLRLFRRPLTAKASISARGLGIAVRKEDPNLRRAMDWALAQDLRSTATYAEIYRKYFPIGFY